MLLSNLQPWDGDKPITYERLLDVLGLDDALWACRAEPQYDAIWRRYAVWCVSLIQHIVSKSFISYLHVTERHIAGKATDEDLVAASDAATDVLDAAKTAIVAATGTASVVNAAEWIVNVAWDTLMIALAAEDAARVASQAEGDDAIYAAKAPMRQRQADAFRMLVTTGELP